MRGKRKSNMIAKREQTVTLKIATSRGALFRADCLAFLPLLKNNSVDCIFADPPFNLGKNYGSNRISDRLPDQKYLGWAQTWLSECVRVLRPGGSLFVYHIPKWLIPIGTYLNSLENMEFRDWIAIKMKNGFPIRNRLHPAHYGLLYYVKLGRDFTFNVVRTSSPVCRHCGGLIRDYGGYRNKYKTLKGKSKIPLIQLDDIWDDTTPNIHRKSRPKGINELPLTISERVLLISTKKSAVFLDPFAGGGSALQSAELNGRYWIGCELGATVHASKRIVGAANVNARARLPKRLALVFKEELLSRIRRVS